MADVSLAALALRLAVSMGVVIGLMLLAAKLLRRAQAYAYASGAGKGRTPRSRPTDDDTTGTPARRRGRVTTIPIEIGSIAPLSRTASVAIVRASGHELVLGVTETQVTLLHATPQITEPDDAIDLDGLHAPTVQTVTTTAALPSPTAARIAATGTDTPDRGAGLPAWTDALETLRAMTVRR